MTSASARQSALERMRRHREEMQLAVAEGLSLEAARERLATLRAHASRLYVDPAPELVPPAGPQAEPVLQWWQRD
jgi:hypothetical protein